MNRVLLLGCLSVSLCGGFSESAIAQGELQNQVISEKDTCSDDHTIGSDNGRCSQMIDSRLDNKQYSPPDDLGKPDSTQGTGTY